MKWVPAPFWLILAPKARGWGIVWLLAAALLSLVMLPLTIVQLQALFGFGARPIRLDYLVLLWATVPWLWESRGSDPLAPAGDLARRDRRLADRAPADGAVPEVRRPRGRRWPSDRRHDRSAGGLSAPTASGSGTSSRRRSSTRVSSSEPMT